MSSYPYCSFTDNTKASKNCSSYYYCICIVLALLILYCGNGNIHYTIINHCKNTGQSIRTALIWITYGRAGRQTDRLTDRQTGRTDIQTDKHTDKHTDIQTDRHTD